MKSAVTRAAFAVAAALLLSTSAVTYAQSVEELVKKGEVFDEKFQPSEALKFYLAAQKQEPRNPAIMCRIARQYRHLMQDATAEPEKLKLGRIALEYSQAAVSIAPNLAEAQLSIAITHGKMLPMLGKKEQVQISPRIKTAVDKAIELDPRNDLAWHVLGRWNRILADVGGLKRAFAGALYGGLPTGSNEVAEKCLTKAIALNPNRCMHYIELGRVYAQMGRKDDARRFINKGLEMPVKDRDDAEIKTLGRQTLTTL